MDKLKFTNKVLDNLNNSIHEDGKVGLAKFIELTIELYEELNSDTLTAKDAELFFNEVMNPKDANEALTLANVSQQSELLAFRKWQKDNWKDVYLYSDEFMIREFKKANCG